jgi:hypothetical protein
MDSHPFPDGLQYALIQVGKKETFIKVYFQWYLKRVKCHMERVLASFDGDPDIHWWRRMVMATPEGVSGHTTLSGWISDFFPYRHFGGKSFLNNTPESRFKYFRSPAVTFTPVSLVDGV